MRTLTSIEELDFAAAMPSTVPATVVVQKASDHTLLEETLAGDEDAFAELVSRYRNQITSYIYRMTNDYDGAVDLAQETFLRVYRAAGRYQTTHAFSTYIFRHCDQPGNQRVEQNVSEGAVSLTGLRLRRWAGIEIFDADGAPAGRNLATRKSRAVFKRSLSTLPEKYARRCVPFGGKTLTRRFDLMPSEGTVKSRTPGPGISARENASSSSVPSECERMRATRREIDESELNQRLTNQALSHLEVCSACRDFRAERASLRELVGSLEPVAAPGDFEMRLRARIANEQGPARQPFIFRFVTSTGARAALV